MKTTCSKTHQLSDLTKASPTAKADHYISLSAATRLAPCKANGKRIHIATITRWARRGLRGVRLRTVKFGRTPCTTEAWLHEFFEALAEADEFTSSNIPRPPSTRERDRAARRAREILRLPNSDNDGVHESVPVDDKKKQAKSSLGGNGRADTHAQANTNGTRKILRGEAKPKRKGRPWTFQFDGESATVHRTSCLGFEYIYELVRSPGKQFDPRDLLALVNPRTSSRSACKHDSGWQAAPAVETLDTDAISAIQSALEGVQEDIVFLRREIDRQRERGHEVAQLESKLISRERQQEELADLLKGGSRKLDSSDRDKARQRVHQAIRLAREKIQKAGLPALAEHLEERIHSEGGWFSYQPDVDAEWILE
ncbi:MAG: DUF1580 domain-containing protein [Phycisphaeraceae bacterium]